MKTLRLLEAGLARLGRFGTWAVAASVFIGIGFPWLGRLCKPYVTEAVLLLLITSCMRVDLEAVGVWLRRPLLVGTVVLWTMLAVPAIFGCAGVSMGLDEADPELFTALMLQAVASPIMSAPALAALLGLDAALVLVTLVFSTMLVPVTAPLFAAVFVGSALSISPFLLAVKLVLMLAGAAGAGLAIRALAGKRRIGQSGDLIDGFNVLVLFIFVAAVMESVGVRLRIDTAMTIRYTVLAFAVCWAILLVSYAVFIRAGSGRAMAIGYVVSQRNMGLMLAATGGVLPDRAWLYFALAQFPIFLSPALLQIVLKRKRRNGR